MKTLKLKMAIFDADGKELGFHWVQVNAQDVSKYLIELEFQCSRRGSDLARDAKAS